MSNQIGRRSFIGKIGGTCTACLIALHGTGCDGGVIDTGPIEGVTIDGNTITIDLSASGTSSLNNEGGFLLIGGARVFVTRSEGQLNAMSSICPHEKCDVNDFRNSEVLCSCHTGVFLPDGTLKSNVSGQKPRTSLAPYSLSQVGDIVTITKS